MRFRAREVEDEESKPEGQGERGEVEEAVGPGGLAEAAEDAEGRRKGGAEEEQEGEKPPFQVFPCPVQNEAEDQGDGGEGGEAEEAVEGKVTGRCAVVEVEADGDEGLEEIEARRDGGVEEAPGKRGREEGEFGTPLRMGLRIDGEGARGDGEGEEGEVGGEGARLRGRIVGCEGCAVLCVVEGGDGKREEGEAHGRGLAHARKRAAEGGGERPAVAGAQPAVEAEEREEGAEEFLAAGDPGDGLDALGVERPEGRGEEGEGGGRDGARPSRRVRRSRQEGEEEGVEEEGVERVERDVDEVVRAHAGAEQGDVGHIGDVGGGHPDGGVARVRERLLHVRRREAVLHEGAAEGVVVVVEAQELEAARLGVEEPDGGDQQENGEQVLSHAAYYSTLCYNTPFHDRHHH